jgi:hypothetical protein
MKLKQFVLFVFLLSLPVFIYPKLRVVERGFKWSSKSKNTDLFEDVQSFYNEVLMHTKSYQRMLDNVSSKLATVAGKEKATLTARMQEYTKELNSYLPKKDEFEKKIRGKINSGKYDLNLKNDQGIRFLSWLIMNDCAAFLNDALNNGANPVLLSFDGMNSLHVACEMESARAIETLTNYIKSLLNAQDNKGNAPLHYLMSTRGQSAKVNMVLSCKPNLTLKNKDGRTPADLARKDSRNDLLKLVEEA